MPPPDLDAFRDFFLTEVESAVPEIERTDRVPVGVLDKAAALGCYRLALPAEFGGFGMSTTALLPYLEVSAMGPGVGRMLVHLSNGIWRPIEHFGNSTQRSLLSELGAGDTVIAFCLTEASGGTGRDLRSRGRRHGDGWLLSGEKHLITFGDRADYFLLIVATDDRAAKDSLTAFLVPRGAPGFDIEASQRTMGLHGTGHAWLAYDEMYVDDAHRLGEVGQGLDVGLFFLDYSRVSLSACMVGLGERAIAEAAAFAHHRSTFGKPIADRQAIQAHLADMRADVDASRGLVQRAAARHDAGEDITVPASTAKLFCLNMIGRVTDLALRVHGGYGYTIDAPIERIYRDARGFWFEEGTQEIQRLVVGRQVLADNAAS